MKAYVDASVVLRVMLDQPGAMEKWQEWDLVVTSELLPLEAFRTLDRLRVKGGLTDAQFAEKLVLLRTLAIGWREVAVDSPILRRAASPFPTAIGALDAIHLSTALLWVEQNDEPLTFLTHDTELAIAAQACGLEVRTR